MKHKSLAAAALPLVAAVIAGAIVYSSNAGSAQAVPLMLRDSNNQLIEPLQISADARATVFLFTSSDCPISNRYAPEYRRLYEAFEARGVRFWLVYPNPADSPEVVRGHLDAFAHPMRALRDPEHLLVKRAKVTVTPEAAVFDNRGQLTYRGRIDDRYARIGLERPAPTEHDLFDALKNTLAGKRVVRPVTQAVGCFIPD